MPDIKQRKILLVHNGRNPRKLHETLLAEEGYLVDTASNGTDALGKLRKSAYDLVVTDMHMPGLDGVELYAHSLKRFPFLRDRFLFITGAGSDDGRKKSVISISDSGRNVIKKPFSVEKFLEQIRALTTLPSKRPPMK